jgi:hypothetical protein
MADIVSILPSARARAGLLRIPEEGPMAQDLCNYPLRHGKRTEEDARFHEQVHALGCGPLKHEGEVIHFAPQPGYRRPEWAQRIVFARQIGSAFDHQELGQKIAFDR